MRFTPAAVDIYYNTALLSRVYEQKQAAEDHAAMDVIQGRSPVAWQHINLIGQFEFSAEDSKVDIDALVPRYSDPNFWKKSLQPKIEAIQANFTFLAGWAKLANTVQKLEIKTL